MGTGDVTKAKDTKRLPQVLYGEAPSPPGRSGVLWLCRLMDSVVPQRQGHIGGRRDHPRKREAPKDLKALLALLSQYFAWNH